MLFSKAGAKVTFFCTNFIIFLKKTCKISPKKPIFAPRNGAVEMYHSQSSNLATLPLFRSCIIP